jgi:hypothetical protein
MLGSLVKAALNVAVTPIEVVKDVVTLGGSINDKKEPYTLERLKKAQDHLNDALD